MGFEGVLAQIRAEIPGFTAAAAGSLDGALFTSEGQGELAGSKEMLLSMLRGYHGTYEKMGGAVDFGSNDEFLISASKGFLLAKVHHEKSRFVVVHLASSGNIGYLRFRMREYLRKVAAA